MPKNIAVVLKGYPRLSETFIAQELYGLERLGYRLAIFSMRRPRDEPQHPIHAEIQAPVIYLPEYLHEEPFRVIRAAFKLMARRSFWQAFATWIGDVFRDPSRNRARRFGQACVLSVELPSDTAHLYAHFIHTPASVAHYASLITALPWSCSAHAKDIWTSPEWDLKAKLEAVNWVTTCTAVGLDRLRALATRADDVHLIYHGIDLARFPHFERPRSTRTGKEVSAPIRLLSVGRAVEKKGFDTMLDALAQLPTDLAWRWVHIGGGEDLDALKARAERLGINACIDWCGPRNQSDILAAYRRSDLFVLPCRIASNGDRDGLPNVLVEALSQGLACISTPISAIVELIRDDHLGLLIPPNNATDLADAISQLAQNPTQRDALGRTGEELVRTEFAYESGLRKLDQLFARREPTTKQSPATVNKRSIEAVQ
ncbi:MAG: glycosyltransferase family 4 protein [Hyphomicrobiaceae bacterium]